MRSSSTHDLLNDRLQHALAQGQLEPLLALLDDPDHQRLIEQSSGPTPFLPGLRLRLTVQMLHALVEDGPWSGSRLGERVPMVPAMVPGQTPLMRAVGSFDDLTPAALRNAMARTMLLLLLPHQDVYAVDDEKLTALERAARVHNDGAFDRLIEATDPHRLANGVAGLMREAVQHGSLAMVRRVLPMMGEQVDSIDPDGNTLLHRALMREDKLGEREAIMDLLLPAMNRSIVWRTNQVGHTPLALAVRLQDQPSVERLVATYVVPRFRSPMEMLHPAEAAVSNNALGCAETILQALPEEQVRLPLQTWRQQNRLRSPEAQAMVDRLECLWEANQLRATIDEDLATDPSRTLQDRGRARL